MTKARLKGAPQEETAVEPAPAPVPIGAARYYNRELSWLQFNRRVMEEAQNLRHPVLERLRFLSISASNLDEFYMVRVAGLYGQLGAGIVQPSQDGLTPAQQLSEINRFAAGLVNDQQVCWNELKAELATVGIVIVEPKELLPAEKAWLEKQFLARHLPILTPIAVDPAHPFPFIQNRALTVGVELRRQRDGKTMHALLPIPSQLARFIRLPADDAAQQRGKLAARFIRIEFGDRDVHHPAVPRLHRAQPGRLPRPARQRHRDPRGGRGPRRPLRDGAQAPPPRPRDPPGDRRADARAAQTLRRAGARHPRRRRLHQGRHAGACRHLAADRARALGFWSSSRSRSASRSASASSTATASRRSARRTSSSITPTSRSTWWCSCCARRWPIPTSWP